MLGRFLHYIVRAMRLLGASCLNHFVTSVMNKASHQGCQGTPSASEPISSSSSTGLDNEQLRAARQGSTASSFEQLDRARRRAASSSSPGLDGERLRATPENYIDSSMRPPGTSCSNHFVARLSSSGVITLNLISHHCLPPAHIIETNPWYLHEGGFRVPFGLGILATRLLVSSKKIGTPASGGR